MFLEFQKSPSIQNSILYRSFGTGQGEYPDGSLVQIPVTPPEGYTILCAFEVQTFGFVGAGYVYQFSDSEVSAYLHKGGTGEVKISCLFIKKDGI